MPDDLRALTIRQPWASLIAAGAKTIETRSWRTSYRGPVLIHAGKRWAPEWLTWMACDDDRLNLLDSAGGSSHEDANGSGYYRPWSRSLPLGAVVAVADLTDCVPIVDNPFHYNGHHRVFLGGPKSEWPDDTLYLTAHRGPPHRIGDQLPLGDFTPGRWAWLLDNVRPLTEPVPAKGRQGLWRPDADLAARCEAVACG